MSPAGKHGLIGKPPPLRHRADVQVIEQRVTQVVPAPFKALLAHEFPKRDGTAFEDRVELAHRDMKSSGNRFRAELRVGKMLAHMQLQRLQGVRNRLGFT